MNNYLNIALAQIDAIDHLDQNITKSLDMTKEAISKGAKWVLFPELSLFRSQKKQQKYPQLSIQDTKLQPFFELSKKHSVCILLGFPEKSLNAQKVFNTSCFIQPNGKAILYQKIHLFKVNLPNTNIDESQSFLKGKKPVIAEIDSVKVGMSICYDLRFPELYRFYSKNNAAILTIPSSFTKATGEKHWHTLCKARAIENIAFVCAPNQVGIGAEIPTYGHSLVVSPWGDILAEGSTKESLIYASLNLDDITTLRKQLTSLDHRELF